MEKAREEPSASTWSMMFWTIVLVMVSVGGFFLWRTLHSIPERERQEQCRRSCAALGAEYVDVTNYGCFCTDDGIPFVLEADRVSVDYE